MNGSNGVSEIQVVSTIDVRNSALFKLITSINALVNIVLIAFNLAVVICTIKHKNLHSNCHILIGLYFFCYIFFALSVYLPFVGLVNPWFDHFSGGICATLGFLLVVLSFALQSTMLAIGFDRMLCILFPLWYKAKNAKLQMCILLCISSFLPLYTAFVLSKNVLQLWNSASLCLLGDFFGALEETFLINFLVSFCFVMTFCFYTVSLVKIWCHRNSANTQISRQPIIKALLLILAIQFAEWLICCVSSVWIYLVLELDHITQLICSQAQQLLVYLLAITEVPILYICSTEHRKAMQKEFKWLFNLFPSNTTNNSVFPLTKATNQNGVVNPTRAIIKIG